MISRGKIIKKYFEEGLSDLDFHYGGYQGDTWVFERKLGKLTWYIYIYVYRFDPWQITFHLGTSVQGKMQVQAHQIDGAIGNGDILGYWKYYDEDSMVKVLKEMVEIIRSNGIDVLKKLSRPERISTNDEMYHELYLYHKELAKMFVEKTGIISTGYDEKNLKRWFDYIDGKIEELRKGTYDDAAKKELLEMAAFLGEQIVKYKEGKWRHTKTLKMETFCVVYKMKISEKEKVDVLINVLSLLVGKYLGNSRTWLEEPFHRVISEWKVYGQ